MNEDRLEAELAIYSRKARDALLVLGHTEAQIALALQGQISGTRFFPGVTDGVVEKDWLWLECLRAYTRALQDLQSGCIESARINYAEGREFMLEARIGKAAISGFKQKEDRRLGAQKTNQHFEASKGYARDFACKLIAENPNITKGELLNEVDSHLCLNGLKSPRTREVLWRYLKEAPSVIPEHMTKPGPRKK
tara:strand:+ start:32043 stop:32624 length:582 start_codon:yes stop_codon:yes gene_type:complete